MKSFHPYARAYKRDGKAYLVYLDMGPGGGERIIGEEFGGLNVQYWAMRKLNSMGFWTGPNWWDNKKKEFEIYFMTPEKIKADLDRL